MCVLNTWGFAQALLYPSIELGGKNSNNYYATSSPNIDVLAITYGVSNTASYYINPWLTTDLSIGVDEEKTNTIYENNRSLNGAWGIYLSPFSRVNIDASVDYFKYRSDRYDSGNIDLIGLSETLYYYHSPSQFLSFSVAYNDYNYVKTDKKSTKQKYTIGYQDPSDIYISAAYGQLNSTDDSSNYTEQTVSISKYFFDVYPLVFDMGASYSIRDYSESQDRTMSSNLGITYYINSNWNVATDVSYYSELETDMGSTLEATLSIGFSETLNGLFEPTQDTRSTFLFNDAFIAINDGNMDAAAKILDRVLFADEYHPKALFERAMIHHENHEYEASIPLFRRVIAVDDSVSEAYYLLAHNLIQTGQKDDAKAVLELFVNKTGDKTMKAVLDQL